MKKNSDSIVYQPSLIKLYNTGMGGVACDGPSVRFLLPQNPREEVALAIGHQCTQYFCCGDVEAAVLSECESTKLLEFLS